jgi:hypothetical protein
MNSPGLQAGENKQPHPLLVPLPSWEGLGEGASRSSTLLAHPLLTSPIKGEGRSHLNPKSFTELRSEKHKAGGYSS